LFEAFTFAFNEGIKIHTCGGALRAPKDCDPESIRSRYSSAKLSSLSARL
jgi:hypothetical protein